MNNPSETELMLSPQEELRFAVLSKALATTALENPQTSTLRYIEVLPEGGDFPSFRISTFDEDDQADGAILQVSFETTDVKEGKLLITHTGMSYDEQLYDGANFFYDGISDVRAVELLDTLRPLLEIE